MSLVPPDGLTHDPDRGIFAVLAVPWGEAIERPHRDAGHRFHQGSVHQPQDLDEALVNVDHGDEIIGVLVGASTTSEGLWVSVKFGVKGRTLLAIGHRGVSPEIDDAGYLTGLALSVGAPSGLPSARVVVPAGTQPRTRKSQTVVRFATGEESLPSFPVHTPAVGPTPGVPEPTGDKLPSFPPFPSVVGPTAEEAGTAPVAPDEFTGPAWGPVGTSHVLMGSGAKAPTASDPVTITPTSRPIPMSEAHLEEVAARARRLEAQRQEGLAANANWEAEWRERRAEMWRRGDEMWREAEAEKLARPWKLLEGWATQGSSTE